MSQIVGDALLLLAGWICGGFFADVCGTAIWQIDCANKHTQNKKQQQKQKQASPSATQMNIRKSN